MTGTVPNGDLSDLFEDKFARVYADIRRLDQLRATDAVAARDLGTESHRRLDQRMDAQETAVAAALAAAEKAVTAALAASDKAVTKAEVAQAKVNESQNEFRGTLRDQAQMLMPRSETENLVRELRGLIANNSNQFTELRSRIDVGPPSLSTLQTRSDEAAGHRTGAIDSRTLAFAIVGSLVGVVGIVLAIVAFTTK